jgi:hypothetical protein
MIDNTWIRAYGAGNVYAPGEMQATNIRANSNLCIGSDCRNSWPGSGAAVYAGVIAGWSHCQSHLFPSFVTCNSACPGGCYYAGRLSN